MFDALSAWMTVDYAFGTLCANLQCSELVLVHAATGGVGIAALYYAHAVGVKVVATAGNTRKRGWLKEQSVTLVSTTRDANQLRSDSVAWFGNAIGRLDIVLNSLSGDYIYTGFDSINIGGRFVEIGKREIWPANQAHSYRSDVSFVPFDETARASSISLERNVSDGTYAPIPMQVFTGARCGDAFKYLRSAHHIGKVTCVCCTCVRVLVQQMSALSHLVIPGGCRTLCKCSDREEERTAGGGGCSITDDGLLVQSAESR
jgi:NADPH:quinone reductase-like Zn-dependent oxidoreductase